MSANLTMACLGRPFQLGTLYDCRNETTISDDATLWSRDSIVIKSITEECQSTKLAVLVDDVHAAPSRNYKIRGDVQLSFLVGMLDAVGGSATYLTADTTQTETTVRVILRYSCKTFQQWLSMDDMVGEEIIHANVFDEGTTTHVVTGIQYGAEAFFVFERDLEDNEDRDEVLEWLLGVVNKMAALDLTKDLNIFLGEKDMGETGKIRCNYYGDVALDKNPTTFEEAVQILTELAKLIVATVTEDGEAYGVPMEVTLSPLSKLDDRAAQLMARIGEDEANKIELFLEQCSVLQLMASYLLKHDICLKFPGICHQIGNFRESLLKHVAIFRRTMVDILPKIRGGQTESATLAAILSKVESCPVDAKKMRRWLDAKTKELSILADHCDTLNTFSFAVDNTEVEKLTRDNNVKFMIELNFGLVANRNHPFTKSLTTFLKSLESDFDYLDIDVGDDDGDEDFHWFNDTGNVAKLQRASELFRSFVVSNKFDPDLRCFVFTGFGLRESRDSPGNIFLHVEGERKLFEPPSSPGIPKMISVAENEMKLEWDKPQSGHQFVKSYIVRYKFAQSDEDDVQRRETESENPPAASMTSLKEDSEYRFQVAAKCEAGVGEFSAWSQHFKTLSPPPLAETILDQCKEILTAGHGQPAWYQLPLRRTYRNKNAQLQKFDVFARHHEANPYTKVILLLGATGSGKTTLINGLVNYLLGVRMEDNFRFQLITENTNKSQAESQTAYITAYTIYWQPGSQIPYTLTIIDTPGYGDTRGIDQDNLITDQVREFFEMKESEAIDQLDAIGFVAPASDARLTDTQKYVFDSILSIFGKDIAGNIFLMLTFADGRPPPILDAIKTHKLPHQNYFKFNNSVFTQLKPTDVSEENPQSLTVSKRSVNKFDELFWQLAADSFAEFFLELDRVTAKSLTLTREVLQERKRLSVTIDSLQHRITKGVNNLETMRQHLLVIEEFAAAKKANKNFTRIVSVPRVRKVTFNEVGRYVTNCLTCNSTCHERCLYADDKNKFNCSAMNGMGQNSVCRICKSKCHWSKHYNKNFYFEDYVDQEEVTLEDLKRKYNMADERLNMKQNLIAGLANKYAEVQQDVLEDIETVRESLARLDEIAMKPNPLTTVDYIEILIQNAEREKKRGWQARLLQLEAAKERAIMIREMLRSDKPYDPFEMLKQQIWDQCRYSKHDVFDRIKELLGIEDPATRQPLQGYTAQPGNFVGSAISAIGNLFKR